MFNQLLFQRRPIHSTNRFPNYLNRRIQGDKTTLKAIINNNLETLDNNLTLLQKYPNDSELASETIELLNALKQINKHLLPNNQIFDLDSYNPTIQNLINNLK